MRSGNLLVGDSDPKLTPIQAELKIAGLKSNTCLGQYSHEAFIPSFPCNATQVCCNFQAAPCMHLAEPVSLYLCPQEFECLQQHLLPVRHEQGLKLAQEM